MVGSWTREADLRENGIDPKMTSRLDRMDSWLSGRISINQIRISMGLIDADPGRDGSWWYGMRIHFTKQHSEEKHL